MRINYILVDFENVQPADLDLLRDGPFKVRVFLGPQQSRVPVALAAALQPLGSNVEYVLLQAGGRNALDFHIAYYIGRHSVEEPAACFHIISRDTGFDPLVEHLRSRNTWAQRSNCIAEIPYFRPSRPDEQDAQLELVVADLVRRRSARPRTEKTLRNTLHTLFRKELTEHEITSLLAALRTRGVVRLEGNKVTYDLPQNP